MMVIRNKYLRGVVSFLGSTLIVLIGVAVIGIVIPGLILTWIHSGDTWDGPPGEGLLLVFSTVLAAIFSIFPLIGLTSKFYRKFSPGEEYQLH
jgi:hypothetical protein